MLQLHEQLAAAVQCWRNEGYSRPDDPAIAETRVAPDQGQAARRFVEETVP